MLKPAVVLALPFLAFVVSCGGSSGTATATDASMVDRTASSSSSGGSVDTGADGSAHAGPDGAAGSDGGIDGSIESGTCVEAPTLDASDLSCDGDPDCTTVWSGTFCTCGCNCPTAPGNTAAYTRVGDALGSALSTATCSGPPCECAALGIPRCFAHQCALCGNFGVVLKNQPAACDEDAAVGDGGA